MQNGKGEIAQMDKVHQVCYNCGDKHCCRGLCEKINNYLVGKRNKSNKMDSKNGRINLK